MIKQEYLFIPYGVLLEQGYRFVAEMILNKDCDQIPGVPAMPKDDMISTSDVGMEAKISLRSNGIWLTDLNFLATADIKGKPEKLKQAEIMRALLEKGFSPKPIFTGKHNKKLNIVMDCTIIGFYIGQASMLKQTPLGQ